MSRPAKKIGKKRNRDLEEIEAIMAEASLTNEALAYRIKNGIYKKLFLKREKDKQRMTKYYQETKNIK